MTEGSSGKPGAMLVQSTLAGWKLPPALLFLQDSCLLLNSWSVHAVTPPPPPPPSLLSKLERCFSLCFVRYPVYPCSLDGLRACPSNPSSYTSNIQWLKAERKSVPFFFSYLSDYGSYFPFPVSVFQSNLFLLIYCNPLSFWLRCCHFVLKTLVNDVIGKLVTRC